MDFDSGISTGPLGSRTTSSFPLSIGTGIAFETLFTPTAPVYDEARLVPNKEDLSQYQTMWINVGTLFRNMYGALDSKTAILVEPEDYANALLSEIEVIKSLFESEGGNKCTPIFYTCSYDKVYKGVLPKGAILRRPHTDLQTRKEAIHLSSIKQLTHLFSEVKVFDSEIIPTGRVDSLIMTHVAYDLFSAKHFKTLRLLESHTGIIKSGHQWNSKYHDGKNLSNIPFNKKLIKVFGDSEIYAPSLSSIKKSILEIAKDRRWTAVTTLDKVNQDLNLFLKDRYMFEVLKHF